MNALLLAWMARSDCIARSYASSASSESCAIALLPTGPRQRAAPQCSGATEAGGWL
jgi:hypothetical protein